MEDTTITAQQDTVCSHRGKSLLSLLNRKGKQMGDFPDDLPAEASASCDSSPAANCEEELLTSAHGSFDEGDTDCDVCSSVTGSDIDSEDGETNEYEIFEPKMGATIMDKEWIGEAPLSEDSVALHDAWYEECGYGDYMLKEYKEDPNCKVQTSSVKEDSSQHMDHGHCNQSNEIFPQPLSSGLFETDEDRNSVYDKWLLDLVAWERNRLMWLDEVSETEGFDLTDIRDRTFLVKVHDKETVSKQTSTLESKCKEPTVNVNDPDEDYWEAWYRLERLQLHKYLHEMDLPNWYDNLRQDKNCNDVEALGTSAFDKQGLVEDKTNLKCSKNEVPSDVALVYQFTDRNLWRKYHTCFKKGKFRS